MCRQPKTMELSPLPMLLLRAAALPLMSAQSMGPAQTGQLSKKDDESTPTSSLTMYRRWTWPSQQQTPSDGKVPLQPGLRYALRDVGLEDYCEKAEEWCDRMGAAFLEECVENVEGIDGLSQALGPIGRQRCSELRAALIFRASRRNQTVTAVMAAQASATLETVQSFPQTNCGSWSRHTMGHVSIMEQVCNREQVEQVCIQEDNASSNC